MNILRRQFEKTTFVCCALFLAVSLAGCPLAPPPPDDNGGDPPPVEDPDPVVSFGGLFGGLNVEIQSVVIPDDLRPEVKFTATDSEGVIINLAELNDVRFILTYLEQQPDWPTARLTSYTVNSNAQATYDGARLGGTTQDVDGTFTYKFNQALATFDPTITHQVAGQFERVFGATGAEYAANPIFRFRPDGGAVTQTREVVETAQCNTCHTKLGIHGGNRMEMQLCITCHNRQSIDPDTGNSVDFPEMIHKIHRGADLPSVQGGDIYQIIGFRGSVHDYSTVHYPQDVRNCASCHSSTDKSIDESFHLENPSIAGCASCHDRTWFGPSADTPVGFTDHPIPNVSDTSCSTCHGPQLLDIAASHLTEAEEFGPGLALNVTAVNQVKSTKGTESQVQIVFSAEDGAGAPVTDLSGMLIAATVAWPVPEYETYVRETMASPFGGPDGTIVNNNDGTYNYTFAATYDNATPQTYAVALEGRRPYMTEEGDSLNQGTSSNGRMLFALNGAKGLEDRREVVSDAKCNACHDDLRFHGDLRVGVNFCVMCHNPNTTDEGRRPAEAMPPVTVNFKDMIHKIHSGEHLDSEYTVYGFGGTPHDFTEVRFSGKREECSICHVDDSYGVPTPTEALSTMVVQETDGPTVISNTLPQAAACTSCHDSDLVGVHAALATSNNAETCAVCHGGGASADVDVVHALGL